MTVVSESAKENKMGEHKTEGENFGDVFPNDTFSATRNLVRFC